jgi:uncharacterized membrane protein YdjX (TVP38/TMEM64 family)
MRSKALKHEIEFIIFALALFSIWYCGRYWRVDTRDLQAALSHFPLFYRGVLYVVLYVVVTFFLFFSKDIFWVTGALLFGAALSTLFICIAETINAFILFFLARRFGRAFVEKRISKKYRHLDEKLGRISFFWLFIFRAAPLIPYRFLDLGAGITSIHFPKYLAAVILGSPIKMFWIQYILYGVGKNIFTNPQMLVEYFLYNRALMYFSFIYIVMIVMVVLKLRSKV